MIQDEIIETVDYIVNESVKLKNKYVQEGFQAADYVCIFSRTENEYAELVKAAETLGKIVDDTPTGPVFAFAVRPRTVAGQPKVLKIRKPDETRPQRGDADFNTDYEKFKSKYLDNKRFTLIVRKKSEMIELKDGDFDVLAYFSSMPPSNQLGID